MSLHYVEEGIDCGAIVAQEAIACEWEDTGGTLYEKAERAMGDLFEKVYPILRSGPLTGVPQNLDKGSFHWGKELEQASLIDLNKSYRARELINLLRARTFPSKPGCHFKDGNSEYEIRIEVTRKKADL